MIGKIQIENFKCFSKQELELHPLTLLCGVNSGGKSSVIQAILLGMEAIQNERASGNLDLMKGKYNTELFSFEELLYADAEDEIIRVSLYGGDNRVDLQYTSVEEDNNLYYTICGGQPDFFYDIKVWYLGSDRMISQYQIRGNADKLDLGKENEYIAYILERGRSAKISVDKKRSYQDKENDLFASQVNEWLNFILPGNQVIGMTSGTDNMVSLKFGKDFRLHRTNIGYGIGFVLPVIVGGLLAKTGDILIIENPEIHLHPKAQSNMTLFLATIAAAGVQILIETHSDHIVNGIRKAIVNPEVELKATDVGIYYFNSKNQVEILTLDENANLSDWPEDFMEQTEKDLYYLRKMRLVNENKHVDE